MANFSIRTNSGGLIELGMYRDRFHGEQLYLHVDQSNNINSGEDDCSICITNGEVKDLIAMLNDYLSYTEGVTHVVLAAPLLHKAVTITVDESKIDPEKPTSESNS